MIEIESAFGDTVRKYRLKQKLSQEAFAEKAGVHRTYISSIELGKVQVSIGVAKKVIDALEVSLGTFWRSVERRLETTKD